MSVNLAPNLRFAMQKLTHAFVCNEMPRRQVSAVCPHAILALFSCKDTTNAVLAHNLRSFVRHLTDKRSTK